MLNKLKKILQWFVSVCFILSGLIYVGEYTVPAIVLMVLAGVIVLPPVTKKIPAFKFRKAILIITSMVLLSAGMITGENNLSPEVQAKRAAAAEAAASSKAVMEAQKAAESASHAAKETEEAASKKAQEEADAASKAAEMAASKAAVAAEAESTANKKREEANEKIKEYKELIESTLKSSSNYANTDSSNKKAFKKIAADKDSIATFTMAWRQYLKTHMNNARVNGNLDKSQMYFFENMIKLYQNFLPDEMSNAMDESQRHIVANGYQAPCSGYFGQMTRCNGDTAFYNFYCDDGSIVENVQVSISNFGKVDNVRYDNIGFIFWSFEALNRDGQWETVGYATTAVVGGDVVKYIETVGFATVRYNDENPWAILETFDAV